MGHTAVFEGEIDWNFSNYGKLWTYNLNYFEFLLSAGCSEQTGLSLIENYIKRFSSLKDGLEPYPTSLRIINWVKFMVAHRRPDPYLLKAIYWQCSRLSGRLEYHIMGNHLLENGFALVIGGCFLQQPGFYNTGKYIVLVELEKQILADGGHFEQSPMYHHIILHRLLDTINLLQHSRKFNGCEEFEARLRSYASSMISWMHNMSFSDKSFPCFNDAVAGIAPDSAQLADYSGELDIPAVNKELKESGYRMWKKNNAEFCFDAGNVTAGYQAGHTHADTFSFCVHLHGRPVIVDTGVSTYEKNVRRLLERSTCMHNTVTINELNSSEVWRGFRLGRRANVRIIMEAPYRLVAVHDGYERQKCAHQRTFDWCDDTLLIEDFLKGSTRETVAVSRLHFHPDRKIHINGNKIYVDKDAWIEAIGFDEIILETYSNCNAYNDLVPAQRIAGRFSSVAKWRLTLL
ncbi:heparinase II/III family protein [Anseongella ginsenosidimutans]|uniref:heparinase II/III family protein n=1 Tax=Anseongella ginsenosidimutans TaxID=496056 RepID=UPI0013157F08|nr:heparinase II/III family protein [Anseongella ginsenosidimutans]